MTLGGFGGGNRISVKIVGDKSDLDKKLRGAEKSVGGFSKETEAKIKKTARRIQIAFTVMAVAAAKMVIGFDSSMSKITGLVGIAADEVDAMGESLKGISKETAKGPAELAEALFFVTSAGLRGAEALEALEFAAKASTAGLGETAVVADALTSAMNAYAASGLSAEEATNILVATVREGKLEASELGAAIGQVLPIASEMGVTFDEVGASIAAMTRLGLNSAESVTALKSILTTIVKPAGTAAAELAKVGLSSEGLRRQIREEGLLAVLFTLREAFEGNQEALTKVIPNVRALTGFMALTGDSADTTEAIFERLTDTTGTLETAFGVASDTIEFRFNKALTDMKVKALDLRDPLTRFSGQFLPIISDMTHEMTLATRGINAIKDGVITAEGPVAEFAAAIKFMGGDAARADESLRFMIEALGLGAEEFAEITGDADTFSKAAGLTSEELDRLTALIKLIGLEELAQDFELVKQRTQEVRDEVLGGIGPAFEELEDQVDDTADAVRVYADELLALADPSFALISTNRSAVVAQEAYNKAVTEFGVGSSEAIGAAIVLLEATARYSSAQETYNNQIGPAGEEALRRLAAEAGFYAEDLNAVLDFLERIGSATRNLPPVPRGGRGALSQFHSGGVVPGAPGTDVPAILQPGETIRTVSQERALQSKHPGGSPGGGFFGGVGDVPGSISRSITAVATAVDHLFAATVSVFAQAVSEFVDGLGRLTESVSTVSTVIRQSNTVLDKEASALDELSAVTKDFQDVFGPGARNRFGPGFGSGGATGLGPGGIDARPIGGPGARIRFGPGGMAEPGVSGAPGSGPGGFGPGGFGPGPSGGPGANGGSGGTGEPGMTVIVNGFVGSELALAAELDRLLTRRSRSSPLGFQP